MSTGYEVLMEKINSDKREGRHYNAAIPPQRYGMTTTLEDAERFGVNVSRAPVGSVAVFERGLPVRFE
jgi:hypothetical protein